LEVPPDWVRAKGPQVTMKYMKRLFVAGKDKILDLRGLDLTEIPEECLEFEDIEELRLSDNKLKTLPEDILKWAPTLEKLTINNNRLLRLPDVVKSFTALRDLQMNGNEVMDIPNWIGQLKDLRSLKAENNKMRRLPLGIHAKRVLQVSCASQDYVAGLCKVALLCSKDSYWHVPKETS